MEPSSDSVGPDLQVTIHIGASTVSMLIAEPDSKDGPGEPIEFLEKPLPLARDIFRRGRVSRATTEHAVEILLGFQESLREAGTDFSQVERAVVTNILAEAENVEVFQNRLDIACGLHLEVLDDGEMTRLIYLKTRRRLHDTPSMQKRNTLVVHVGPGNTRILLFRKGRIDRYTSYRLGAHRTCETVEATHTDGAALRRLIREQISGQVSQIFLDYERDDVEDLVVIGYEIQLLVPFLTKGSSPKTSIRSLQSFVSELAEISEEERVQRYQVDYHTAGAVVPALETNLAIAEVFKLQSLRIPGSDYERGIHSDLPRSPSFTTGFRAEVIRSAQILAQKFKVDAKHAGHVAKLAKILFEETEAIHQLNRQECPLAGSGGHSPRMRRLHQPSLPPQAFAVSHSEQRDFRSRPTRRSHRLSSRALSPAVRTTNSSRNLPQSLWSRTHSYRQTRRHPARRRCSRTCALPTGQIIYH